MSRQKGSSSFCPTPLSESHGIDAADEANHDYDDDDDYADDDYHGDVVDDADADTVYLDGVELLDLNLDPGDVVVVEVLHLLQLILKPENYDFFFENIITFVITVIIIIIIII